MKKQKLLSIVALILVGGVILFAGACSSAGDVGKSASQGCGACIGDCLGCVAGGACSACASCVTGCGDVIEKIPTN